MNQLPISQRAAIVKGLVEGQSIRAVARVTGASKNTVLRLLVDVGEFCSFYQDHALCHLPTRRVEADEIWAFCGAKQRNATRQGQGDIWTFTAIDADSKLMLSWLVGERSPENAYAFMQDVAGRLANRVQLTTDGHHMYLTAVEGAFGYHGVDYAMLVKSYGLASEAGPSAAIARWSAPERRRSASSGTRTRNSSRHPTLSARISPCGCRCAGSRA